MVSSRGNNNNPGHPMNMVGVTPAPRPRVQMPPGVSLPAAAMNMQQQMVNQHYQPPAGPMNMAPVNTIPAQYMTHPSNPNINKPEQYRVANHVPHHYRLLPQARQDCYGGGIPAGSPGTSQAPPQNTVRVVPPTAQTSTQSQPQPQQDIPKPGMGGHSFVPQQQQQTSQNRHQMAPYQYRMAPSPSRPPHHRQPTPPMLNNNNGRLYCEYPPSLMVYPNIDHFSQQSGSQRFFQQGVILPSFGFGYHNQHPPQYQPCYGNMQQMAPSSGAEYFPSQQPPAAGMAAAQPSASMGLAPPPPPATPSEPPPQHMPPPPQPAVMPNIHASAPSQSSTTTRHPNRIPIINPATNKEIEVEQCISQQSHSSGETSERQTPQPPVTNSVAEEFSNKVKEAVKISQNENFMKPNFVAKFVEPVIPNPHIVPTHTKDLIINNSNNNIPKSDIVISASDSKSLVADLIEPSDTPEVSAISDSPVIVPKLVKLLKVEPETEGVVVHKVPPIQHRLKQNKPVFSQSEEEKDCPHIDDLQPVVPTPATQISSQIVIPEVAALPVPANVESGHIATQAAPVQPTPTLTTMVTPLQKPVQPIPSHPVQAQHPFVTMMPQPVQALAQTEHSQAFPSNKPNVVQQPLPQRVRKQSEPKSSRAEIFTPKNEEKELSPAPTVQANGPNATSAEIIPNEQSSEVISSAPSHKTSLDVDIFESHRKPTQESHRRSISEEKEHIIQTETADLTHLVTEDRPEGLSLLQENISSFKEPETVNEVCFEDHMVEQDLELPAASPAQARLTQSIVSCAKQNQPEAKMRDVNPVQAMDTPDTANGNLVNTPEQILNDNELKETSKNDKSKKDKKSAIKVDTINASNVTIPDEIKVDNSKYEKVDEAEDQIESEGDKMDKKSASAEKQQFLPKYKYTDNQWSPMNPQGKKSYDIGFLMQLKDDPLSQKTPDNLHLLEVVMKAKGSDGPISFSMPRPSSESFLPAFVSMKPTGSMRGMPRDPKKTMPQSKSSMKNTPSMSGPSSSRGVISISLGNRNEVKLNETENAWRPFRTKKTNVSEEEGKTEELYKKFRGILNKLTPQKFTKLLDQVKSLDIDTEERLNGVIDLVFEKAIDEPSFSEAYASMCEKLSTLQVPVDKKSDQQFVNFRVLIINKCQNQFLTTKVHEEVVKIERDISECTDVAKKKELQLMLEEENRKLRMRSVGNVRFIGELYKLKMLNARVMGYCMTSLVKKIEEEKLECLCKLLTTIGEQVENEAKEQVDGIFKNMQEIVERKSNKISSRVRFMIQDVIELRRRRWTSKNIIDSQPKTMDQIQKEADQKQRQIELMNSSPMGGSYRRDEGGRNKRGGDSRRNAGGSAFNTNFDSNNWQVSSRNKSIDTSKLKAVGTDRNIKNLSLRPPSSSGWNLGSGAKTSLSSSNSPMVLPTTTMNKYSVLENAATDPATIKNKETYSKGASIEKSSFSSRSDYSGINSRANASAGSRSSPNSGETVIERPVSAEPTPTEPVEPLTDTEKYQIKNMIEELSKESPNNEELVNEVKKRFKRLQHPEVVAEIFNVAWELKPTTYEAISKSLVYLVTSNTISNESYIIGISEHFEFAPDLHIDIPKLYDYLAKFVAPHIIAKHISLKRLHHLSEKIISEEHGHLFLKPLLLELKTEMGPTYVRNKWQESGMCLSQWISEDKLKEFQESRLDFVESDISPPVAKEATMSPEEVHNRLLQLMYKEQSCDCIKGWIKDHVGESITEDWFMRDLIQAICQYALLGPDGKSAPRFNSDRMSKYVNLISEFKLDKQLVESNCLLGLQNLIHRLEHPLGVTLEVFQYLSECYISPEGFLAWEKSDVEPEGKAVMLMALTSFFTNIKEAENEDSCSED